MGLKKPMPPGNRFKPGQSGNPGGRKALPPELRTDIPIEGKEAWERLKAIARDGRLLANPKTAHIYYAANVRIFEIAFGKDPVTVHLAGADGEPLARADLSHYSDDDLATLARIQSKAEQRRLSASADAGGDSSGVGEATAEEV